MKFIAFINVMPLKALLDPQGKAVTSRLRTMKMDVIKDVRVGKRMELLVDAKTKAEAAATVEKACKDILHNPIMEIYEYTLIEEGIQITEVAKTGKSVDKVATKVAPKKTTTKTMIQNTASKTTKKTK